MPSEIESALYGDWADRVSIDGDVGDHCLVEFSISRDTASDSDVLRITVAPNGREFVDRVVATFRNAHVGRIQQPSLDHEFNYLPWYIAGFHSTEIGDGQWSFQLNCHNFRIQWSSDWPGVQRGG